MKIHILLALFVLMMPLVGYNQEVIQNSVPPISTGDYQLIGSYTFERQGNPVFRIDSCRIDFYSMSGVSFFEGAESLEAIYLEINGMPYSSWHTTEAVVDPLLHFPTYLVGLSGEESVLFEYFADVNSPYPFGMEYSCLIQEYPNGPSFWIPVISSEVPVSVNTISREEEVDIYSFEGGVTIRTKEEFLLYDITGRIVYPKSRGELFSRILLPHGVYIFVSCTGTRKFHVK